MAFKVYFDGSQGSKSLTLAAVIADVSVWTALDTDWQEMLRREGLTHFHMKEAMRRQGEFKTWKKDRQEWFINAMITVVKMHHHWANGRMAVFTTSVDLAAHREIQAKRPGLPSPARMCARGLFAKVLNWWADLPENILQPLEVHFDQNESFMVHVRSDWESVEFKARFPVWQLIRNIAPADMRSTPGIQVADVFAWSRNRREADTKDDWHVRSLGLMNSIGQHFAFDRKKLDTYEAFTLM